MTPGVASAGSCPEAIWQSAIWGHEYYEKTAGAFPEEPSHEHEKEEQTKLPTPIVPTGAYLIRQPAAAVVDEE
jgi:hypothetical protein